jgi:uncharacterized membrane protein
MISLSGHLSGYIFSGEDNIGKHSIVRKPQICPKSLTNLDLAMCENRNNNIDVDVHLLHVKSNNHTITVVPLFVTVLLDHYDTYYQL